MLGCAKARPCKAKAILKYSSFFDAEALHSLQLGTVMRSSGRGREKRLAGGT
jgi:hypothetical protein